MRYIQPLGVEHGDLRDLRLLSDESLVLHCKTPSVRSSESCLVLANHLPLVCLCPNLRNKIPPDFESSEILWENVLVSLSGFSVSEISPVTLLTLLFLLIHRDLHSQVPVAPHLLRGIVSTCPG